MKKKKLHRFNRRRMIYHAYLRKIALQYLKAFVSLLKNLPAAVTLFSSLISLKRKYRLNRWFLWLPYVKPQTRVFYEWVDEYFSRDDKILDLGCGICSLDAALLNHGFKDVVCIDVRHLYLKVARELLKRYKKLPLIRADANSVPLISQIFDIIAMLDLSYFSSIDLEACFNEISRLLKPGGILIIDLYEYDTGSRDAKYYLIDDAAQLATAYSLYPIKFLPLYHPGRVSTFGYIMMARKKPTS